jgi:hypothetical protein
MADLHPKRGRMLSPILGRTERTGFFDCGNDDCSRNLFRISRTK